MALDDVCLCAREQIFKEVRENIYDRFPKRKRLQPEFPELTTQALWSKMKLEPIYC